MSRKIIITANNLRDVRDASNLSDKFTITTSNYIYSYAKNTLEQRDESNLYIYEDLLTKHNYTILNFSFIFFKIHHKSCDGHNYFPS